MCMPKMGIAVSGGRSIPSSQSNNYIDLHDGCTSLYSHQKWRNVPLADLYALQHELSVELLILAIMTCVRWNLRLVLIYISLMAKNV